MLSGLAGLSYSDRLALLDLDSLEFRRLRQDLILMYKTMFGLADVDSSSYFTIRTNSITRDHNYRLISSNCGVDVRKYYFSQRVSKV
jgi:hypothetical protein